MDNTNIPPYVGEDGRIYFNYALECVIEFYPKNGEPFRYRILGCEFGDKGELYTIESAGKIIDKQLTVNQLSFLLSFMPCEVIEAGELVELPLLPEEVELYYKDKQKERNRANVEANAKLKGTKYKSLVNSIAGLIRPLELARAADDEVRIAEFEKQKADYEAEQSKILSSLLIDEKLLRKIPSCSECNDTGLIDGRICECAIEQQDAIKKYNAIWRLKKSESR